MVGERYGQSLDIGKEIEKEKEEEQQPLPCTCSPDLRKKNQPAEQDTAENKEEKAEAKQDSEKTAQPEAGKAQESSQGQQEPQQQKQAEAQAQQHAETQAPGQQAQEQQMPPEQETPPELPVTDPVEEDVNAIITKEIPELPAKTSIWTNKWLLGIIFVALITGIFLAWMKLAPENTQSLPQPTQSGPVSLVVYNASEPAAAPAMPDQAQPTAPAAPERIPEQQKKPAEPKSIDELSEFFSEQLKD
ncbi:MAG: hypothetical protein QXM31_00030 [Candidatus Woesearchaeota archaeon]